MEPSVLIAYATRGGSTVDLANTLAEIFREHGMKADVVLAREVEGSVPAGAVVLVAALYVGRLHRDARRFLERNRPWLQNLPVAMFVPGPVRNQEKDWAGARAQLGRELARYPWLKPVAAEVVGGVWNPARLGFPFKLIPALRNMKASDARDWDAIRALARDVAGKLLASLPLSA